MLWNILYENNGIYCVTFNKITANKNTSIRRTKQNRLMVVSNCAICS